MPAAYARLSDEELVLACRAGDTRAWEAVVTRYSRLIYAIPRRAGLSEDAAADVFQEVFTSLVEQLDRIQQPSRIRAWLVTTARRATLRVLRGRLPTAVAAPDAESDMPEQVSDEPLPEDVVEQLEDWHILRVAVGRLDDRCAALLRMLFYTPETPAYVDIARALGVPEGSIGPTRARCLEKLRRFYDAEPERTGTKV